MTQAKAASLTSALFARKGAASPADLVIAELEDGTGAAVSKRKARSKERGAESAQRKKAKLPEVEQDLPLLAFVDAQTSEQEAVPEQPAGEDAAEASAPAAVREDSAAADHAPVEQALKEDDHPDPAASLMAHRPLAFRGGEAADDIGEEGETGPEVAEAAGVAIVDVIEVDEAQDPPAAETAITEAVAVLTQPDSDALDAAAPEPLEAKPLDSEPDGESDSQAAAKSLALPPSEAALSEPGSEDLDTSDAAAAETAVSEGEAAAQDDRRTHETPDDQEPAAAENDLPAASVIGDTVSAEHSGQERASGTVSQTAESPASLSVDSQDRVREAAAVAEPPRAAHAFADQKDRDMPEAAASPAVLAAKRGGNFVASPWRMAAVIALGVGLGFTAYALWPQETTAPQSAAVEPTPDSAGPEVATTQAVAPETAVSQTTSPEETASDAADAAVIQTAAGPAAQSAALADDNQAPGVALSQPEPSFDIIRIEPNGQSIIAGRAEPFSEWILLNNGEPIGAVRADLNGEWVILPDASLVPGANDFSLVPKTERGKVAIPAADGPPAESIKSDLPESGLLAPRSEASPSLLDEKLAALGQDAALPLPRLKPAAGDAEPALLGVRTSPAGGYQIQIASVRQSAAAERERARLVDVYPALLGDLGLRVQEASIEGAGVFYRLRSGPIVDLADARELCRQLELRGQGCLVVVRADDDKLPGPAETNAVQPSSAPGLSPTQQAENPD